VSLHTSQQNEQLNSQLPPESSSTENYLNSEAAEQRQQVTLFFLKKMSTPYFCTHALIFAQICSIDLN
jgi:hypothetical protein